MPSTVDALCFVGPSLFGAGQSVEELLRRLDAAGVDVAVVAPARPPDYALPPANDAVAAATMASGGRLAGLARVDPNRPDAAQEARRALDLGLVGVLLHPREEVFPVNDPRVDAVLDVCAERSVPAVVVAGFPFVSEALQAAELAARHADVPIVMTNGGQLNISGLGQVDALTALRTCPNLRVATNGVYRQDFLEGVVRDLGADRLVFASASPHFDACYEVLRVRLAAFGDAEKADVLGRTAARLFSL